MNPSSPISLPQELRLTPLPGNVVLVEGPLASDPPAVPSSPGLVKLALPHERTPETAGSFFDPRLHQSHQEPVRLAARAMGVPTAFAPPPMPQQARPGRRRRRGPKGRRFSIPR